MQDKGDAPSPYIKTSAGVGAPNKKNAIQLSKYNVIIKNGKMIIETCNFDEPKESLPQWAQNELDMLDFIRVNENENMEERNKDGTLGDDFSKR